MIFDLDWSHMYPSKILPVPTPTAVPANRVSNKRNSPHRSAQAADIMVACAPESTKACMECPLTCASMYSIRTLPIDSGYWSIICWYLSTYTRRTSVWRKEDETKRWKHERVRDRGRHEILGPANWTWRQATHDKWQNQYIIHTPLHMQHVLCIHILLLNLFSEVFIAFFI